MLLLHLATALASDMLLVLTAVACLLYLRQERALKSRKQILSLPSIQAIDLLALWLLILAFLFMTVGIIAGSVLAYQQWGSSWYLDPRQIWSIANWTLFAFVLASRCWVGWRGQSAIKLTLVGVNLVLVGFIFLHIFSWSKHAEL